MYSTYETGALGQTPDCESQPSDRKKAIILGGGPNRIGQGIEFDYCCCHAAFALGDLGIESIMVNCNPETVSTDYDTSDRLYFEPLTAEDVLELIHVEQSAGTLLGVIVQFGGQTPLKLAHALEQAGVPILGTSPDAIDLAEDRERFQGMLNSIGLMQPENAIARNAAEAITQADALGFPFVMRPSYVLGGRGMEIIRDHDQLTAYLTKTGVSDEHPILLDHYLSRATEVDVDAICDGADVFVAGIMEHIEEAGVHSGDSACSLPPFSLKPETVEELKRQTEQMARALNVRGLMNVQFAIEEPHADAPRIYVLEVNPRASRTVPFVAKAIGKPVAAIAAKVMAGEKLASFDLHAAEVEHIAVKEAVFPFARFPGVDTILGPEMRSTGEVMGLDWKRPGEPLSAAYRPGLRQEPAGGRRHAANQRRRVHLGEGRRQAVGAGTGAHPGASGLPHRRHRRHGGLPRGRRAEGRAHQEGAGGPPQHRRRHEERRHPARFQHHRGAPVAGGQLLPSPQRPDDENPLLHHRRRRSGRRPGHRGPGQGRVGSPAAAEL